MMTLRKTAALWTGTALMFAASAVCALASPESDAIKAGGVSTARKLVTVAVPKAWTPGANPSDSPTSATFADPALTQKRNRLAVSVGTSYAANEEILYKKFIGEARSKQAFGVERITVAGAPAYVTVIRSSERLPGGKGNYSDVMIGGPWSDGKTMKIFTITFYKSTLDPEKSFAEPYGKGELAEPEIQAVLETLRFNNADANAYFDALRAEKQAKLERRAAAESKLAELKGQCKDPDPADGMAGTWKAPNGAEFTLNDDGSITTANAWKMENGAPVINLPGALAFANGAFESTAADGTKTAFAKVQPVTDDQPAADPIAGVWKVSGAALRSQPLDAQKAARYFSDQAVNIICYPNGVIKTGSVFAGLWEKQGDAYKIDIVAGPMEKALLTYDGSQFKLERNEVVTITYSK